MHSPSGTPTTRARPGGPWRTGFSWAWLAVAVATAASLALRLAVPLWLLLDAGDDDELAVRLGHSLLTGWLGPFDLHTLEKPPGFPLFLAAVHAVPLPFALVEQLLHLGAAALAAYALARLSGSRPLGVAAYVVLALDPSFVGGGASRLVRDNWYSSVCLALFALATLAMRPQERRRRGPATSAAATLLVGVAAAVALSAYWLGRVEHPWLLPALAVVLGGGALSRVLPRTGLRARTTAVAGVLVACLLALGGTAAAVAGVERENGRHYGVALTDDFSTGSFALLYADWQSVRAGPARRFVPVSAAQRRAVYRISAAARELEPTLERRPNKWIRASCAGVHVCDDFAAGWWPYALRDATYAAGHLRTAAAAQAFWSRIAHDITTACAHGSLRCDHPVPDMLPSPSRVSVAAWAVAMVRSLGYLVTLGPASPPASVSGGDPRRWPLFASTVRGLPRTLAAQQARERASGPARAVVRALRITYAVGIAVGAVLALLGLAIGWQRRRPGERAVVLVAVAAALAVIGRALLLGLVDSTSFPAAHEPTYALPATSFLLLFVVCGVGLLLREWRSGQRESALPAADAEQAQEEAREHRLDAQDQRAHGGDRRP